jgi:hypothetical protein
VAPAKGQYREHPPELGAGQVGAFSRTAATDLAKGVSHLAQELVQMKFAPSLGLGPAAPRPVPEHDGAAAR